MGFQLETYGLEDCFWMTPVSDHPPMKCGISPINTDAFAPSIAVIGKQILAPGETLDVFNPFSEFESSVPLTELEYSFCLLRESNERQREHNRQYAARL
ncbi:MAG: hypothetical protein WB711_03630 [Terriglobales bacterium]